MDNLYLQIAMRYVHIVSAVILVGGMSCVLFCFLPAVKPLDPALRDPLLARFQGRFLKVTAWAIVGLLVSGIYNWIMLAPVYKQIGPLADALIGTKVLLALIVFAIVFARMIGLIKPAGDKRILMIAVHLAAIIILLAAILRYYRLDLPNHITH